MTPLALFVSLIFIYSLVSQRLERTIATPPIIFTAAGLLMFPALPWFLRAGINAAVVLHVAEIGLVLLLFIDASRTDLANLRHLGNIPIRLLGVGTLLAIPLGMLAARLFLPSLSIWEAGILAAILSPTDASLGQAIMSSPRVPMNVREALSIESGLNDGLAVPFMLFFMALAAARIEGGPASLVQFIFEQLGLGTLTGLVIGLAGGWLIGRARRYEWIAESFLQIGVVGLPMLCLVVSEVIGASMFIASFVAGLTVQAGYKEAGRQSVAFAEQWGQLLNLAIFFVFGLVVARDWPHFTLAMWLYALLSLTVVRMLPVAIALIGSRLSFASMLFMGWFGPRGLASIVLGLVYLEEELHLPGELTIRYTLMVTVLLSIFAHGLSAKPGIELYTRTVSPVAPDAVPAPLAH
ncbi:MAG: cation:proton antiporter [Candidatus Binataceae bacterium]|jgi:NhaP-type Na+/H+ or K+/H+ antiporter